MLSKARIQLIRSLSGKAAREENGLFVAEGRKMIGEALAAGADIECIYILQVAGTCTSWKTTEQAITEHVSAREMERISHFRTPSDALAVIRIPRRMPLRDNTAGGLSLCLDGVQDPGNLGTIIRTADWFGIGKIICSPDSADCYNPKTVQATMGALFRVTVDYGPLEDILSAASARGTEIYGTFLDGENIYASELSQDSIIVMGSEGGGISQPVSSLVGRKLFIPPYPAGRQGSESLNVAAAAAVVCAEFRRRAHAVSQGSSV